MSEIAVKVAKITQESDETRSFRLIALDGRPLPAFQPGSHLDVKLANGLTRQYSLCGDPEDLSSYLIAVKKEPQSRGGSRYMHENVSEEHTLTISAPRNLFSLDEDAPHSVLLAGGIGVTPIIAMADRLRKLSHSFEFHYFTRGPSNTAFHDRLTNDPFARGLHLHYALTPDAVKVLMERLLGSRTEGAQLYLCGPKPFMDTVVAVAKPVWPAEAIHLEHFVTEGDAVPKGSEEFEVTLAKTGGTFTVTADKTIAQTLLDNGVDVALSCEQGVCGTCLTDIVEGEADHHDLFLSSEERDANKQMCICISRAKSRSLVLDI